MYFIGIFIALYAGVPNGYLATPLDDYVNIPDPMFSWKRLETYPQPSYTLYILNMTSQQWFDGKIITILYDVQLFILFLDSLSSQPIWWHYIAITVPRTIRRRDTAFLFISGGDNTYS